MGKYRAQMSVPNHLFGTVREYDDADPVVQHRVASGMLVRVDAPVAPQKPTKRGVEASSEAPAVKRPVRKRKAKTKPEPEVETVVPEANPEPEPEVEESPTVAPSAGSSVQTSWRISD